MLSAVIYFSYDVPRKPGTRATCKLVTESLTFCHRDNHFRSLFFRILVYFELLSIF
jgi:hypothetical protein